MGTGGMSLVGELTRQCAVEHLNVGDCNLTSEQLFAFKESLKDAKVNISLFSTDKHFNCTIVSKLLLNGAATGDCNIQHGAGFVRLKLCLIPLNR